MQNSPILIARKSGVATFWILILSFIIAFFLAFFQKKDTQLWADLISAIFTLVTTVTYTIFLFGVLDLAKRSSDLGFVKNTKIFIYLGVACGLIASVTSLSSLIPISILLLLLVPELVLFFALGVMAIRIAPNFKALESTVGIAAQRAAKWHKVSGWLIVSVVLFPFGLMLSLVADFYMWKVLGEYLKKNPST